MKQYQNEHLTVGLECRVHLLHQTWVGLPSSESFRDGELSSLTMAKKHHIKRWLIDLRLLRLFNPMDLRWFVHNWLPQAAVCLPQNVRVAIVLNDFNQFGKLGADLILRESTNLNQTLSSRYFLDIDEARQWLLLKPVV